MKNRRKFLKELMGVGMISVSPALITACGSGNSKKQKTEIVKNIETAKNMFFEISLAQWSLNKSIFGKSRELGWSEFGKRLKNDPDSLLQGEINPLDFPTIAKNKYGISGVEYVNTFYYSKAEDTKYLQSLKQRCDDAGVESVLIMIDAEGNLGDLDDTKRKEAVEKHYKWVDAAKFLGCHSIRVNAHGEGTAEEVKAAAIDGLGQLSEYGRQNSMGIIVENHGGYSSNGQWLSDVMKQVNNEYCGTLPDFGNFCIERSKNGCSKEYDRYQGVKELMPFAKGVSAKTNEFDENGNEINIDYQKMLQIVKEAGYAGYIGIEYEGSVLSEDEGVKATKSLLERIGKQLS